MRKHITHDVNIECNLKRANDQARKRLEAAAPALLAALKELLEECKELALAFGSLSVDNPHTAYSQSDLDYDIEHSEAMTKARAAINAAEEEM